MASQRRPGVGLLLVAFAGALAAWASPSSLAADAGPQVLVDEWHAVYIQDRHVGYHHERETREGTGDAVRFVNEVEQQFTIRRAGIDLKVAIQSRVTEDARGRLVFFTRSETQGAQTHVTSGTVEGDWLVLTTTHGSTRMTRRVPNPGGLCPWGLRRLAQRMGYEPGTTYRARAFVPDFPERAIDVTVRVGPREPVRLFEVTKQLHRVQTELGILPGVPSVQWVDEEGNVWLTRVVLAPGLAVEMRRATREVALAPHEPADLLLNTFVRVDRPIPTPRTLESLEVRLSPLPGAQLDLQLPSSPWQHVESTGAGVLVHVRRAHVDPAKSYAIPYTGNRYEELTKPTPWLETQDPAVAQMSREALGDERDAVRAARRIERYVAGVIENKDLGSGMATAAEVAAQKSGDCTEHAVLAAALARAAGIPSRVVGGLVYMPALPGSPGGGFAYHMWTEVFVGEWLPIDAALGGHDATHLALVKSGLADSRDLLALSSAIIRVLGKVHAEVVALRSAGPGNGDERKD